MKISIHLYNELREALSRVDLNQMDSSLLEDINLACKTLLDNQIVPQKDEEFWKGLQKESERILSKRHNKHFVAIKVSSVAELVERIMPIFGAENAARIICSFHDWSVFQDEDLLTISNLHKILTDVEIADKLFSLLCKERCRRNPNLN